jgi:hypothetical protein
VDEDEQTNGRIRIVTIPTTHTHTHTHTHTQNVVHWIGHPNFNLIVHDVVEPIMLEVDQIYHLACPASPPHYQYNPIKTIKTSTMGMCVYVYVCVCDMSVLFPPLSLTNLIHPPYHSPTHPPNHTHPPTHTHRHP